MSLYKSGNIDAKRLVKNKRIPVQTIILKTLYGTGLIATALIAPKFLSLFAYGERSDSISKRTRSRLRQAMFRLEAQGLAHCSIRSGKTFISLTKKGEDAAEKALLQKYTIPEPVLWDGKWRLVIFDIVEDKKYMRRKLRLMLRNTGFYLLQDSVWVYPFPCDEFIQIVRAQLKFGTGELLTCIAEGFEYDKHLREHFKL